MQLSFLTDDELLTHVYHIDRPLTKLELEMAVRIEQLCEQLGTSRVNLESIFAKHPLLQEP